MRNPIILIITLAAILRLGYWVEMRDNPMTFFTSWHNAFDQEKYVSLARDLAAHEMVGSKTIWQSAAYSYLIAAIFKLFGDNLNYLFVFQILWGLVSIYLIYQSSLLLFDHNRRLALTASGLMAMYSPLIMYECAALRDLPIAYANVFAFYFILKVLRNEEIFYGFLAGFFTGLSTVLRPGLLGLAIVPYLLAVLKIGLRRKLILSGVFVLGVVILIVPLTIRNFALGQRTILEKSTPEVFWSANAYDSPGIGYTYSRIDKQLAEETQSKVLDTLGVWWREVNTHPKSYARLYGRKFKMLFNGYEIPGNLSYDLARENSTVLKIAFLNFMWIAPLTLLGMALALRRLPSAGLLYLFVAVLGFFIMMFQVEDRYRLGLIPFFIIFAAVALDWMVAKLESRQWRKLALTVGVIAAMVTWTRPDEKIIAAYFGHRIRSIDYMNLASAYFTYYGFFKGQMTKETQTRYLTRGLKNYQRAYDLSGDNVQLKRVLLESIAGIYLELGFNHEALRVFRKILEIVPDHPSAGNFIGLLENNKQAKFSLSDKVK